MDTHILKSSKSIDYLYGRDKTQNLPTTIFSLWSLCGKEDRDEDEYQIRAKDSRNIYIYIYLIY